MSSKVQAKKRPKKAEYDRTAKFMGTGLAMIRRSNGSWAHVNNSGKVVTDWTAHLPNVEGWFWYKMIGDKNKMAHPFFVQSLGSRNKRVWLVSAGPVSKTCLLEAVPAGLWQGPIVPRK